MLVDGGFYSALLRESVLYVRVRIIKGHACWTGYASVYEPRERHSGMRMRTHPPSPLVLGKVSINRPIHQAQSNNRGPSRFEAGELERLRKENEKLKKENAQHMYVRNTLTHRSSPHTAKCYTLTQGAVGPSESSCEKEAAGRPWDADPDYERECWPASKVRAAPPDMTNPVHRSLLSALPPSCTLRQLQGEMERLHIGVASEVDKGPGVELD